MVKFISENENIQIKHAKNGGEGECGRYKLDGVCETTKTIYEFHGSLGTVAHIVIRVLHLTKSNKQQWAQ